MATKIVTKNGSGAPLASDLVQGELAVDLTNKRLYTEDSGGTVIEIGTSPSTIDINAGTVDGISSLSTANGTDVSFAGASATKFFWDASAESLGIGTTSPTDKLHVGTNSGSTQLKIQSGSSINNCILHTNGTTDSWRTGMNLVLTDGSYEFYDDVNNVDRMVITSSGNVGIGTTTPAYPLEVAGITYSDGLIFRGNSTPVAAVASMYRPASQTIALATNGTERLRIDSSGNLLVGKTASNSAVVGCELLPSGIAALTANGNQAIYLNRLTSDGAIAEFRKDNTTVGSIAVENGNINIGSGDTGLRFDAANNALIPVNISTNAVQDNTTDIGSTNYRWKDLYLSGGVYLGGTGAANHLDDYEEGTWTPASGSNSTVTTVYSAWYRKVGDLVTVNAYITSITTTSEDFTITGLPFTNSSTYGHANIHYATGGGIANDSGGNLYVQQSSQYIQCNAGSAIIGGAIMLSATYKIS